MHEFPPLESIKVRRKRLGLTQQFVAKHTGISQSLLAKIEMGKVKPNYEIAKRIFENLDAMENSDSKKAVDVMNKKVIMLKPEDTVSKAVNLALRHGISQFPVEQNGSIIGTITTSDLLDAGKKDKIGKYISPAMPTVGKSMPASTIRIMLKNNAAVLVMDSGKVMGIITAEELL
ncbi:MAG: CBS domain-containing protein [Candidatus Marsarchaeota archaeon]|nr:CBS domain-containing protein [Candidatus Marsarchaeota archaeon]